MSKRYLGTVPFSPVTFGCMAIADAAVWGPQDEKETIRAMHLAADMGIFSFDTAAMYGNGLSEQIVGRAFGNSDKVTIATKLMSSRQHYDEVISECEKSLKNLQRDVIDLYQIHWPSKEVPFEETASALLKLKEQGKIREIGVSNFGVQQLSEMEKYMQPVSNQLMYNLFFRAPEANMVELHKKYNMGMMTYSSIAQGLLTGKYQGLADVPVTLRRTRLYPCTMNPASPHREGGCQELVEKALGELRIFCADKNMTMAQVALAWLLHKEGVTTVIAGARSEKQVKSNVLAMTTDLTEEDMKTLDALSADLKAYIGNNLDAWRGNDDVENRRIW